MLTQTALDYFQGASALAKQLDECSPQAVQQWGDYPPYGRQCEIELITGGALKREPRRPRGSQTPCNHRPVAKAS